MPIVLGHHPANARGVQLISAHEVGRLGVSGQEPEVEDPALRGEAVGEGGEGQAIEKSLELPANPPDASVNVDAPSRDDDLSLYSLRPHPLHAPVEVLDVSDVMISVAVANHGIGKRFLAQKLPEAGRQRGALATVLFADDEAKGSAASPLEFRSQGIENLGRAAVSVHNEGDLAGEDVMLHAG